ncbi:AAA family ATPase [Nostoc sp.]|uniref:AAA family ATPase n=1 Tax=Nostoc sp. TaxID=1180 RepID=UPI003FA5E151
MEFSPGINIIVGRNNAGKTSLLEVLTLDFENHPHRSLKTLPNKLSSIQEESKIEITIHINKEELRSFIKYLSSPIGIPAPKLDDNYIEFILLEYENEPEIYNTEYIKYLDDSVKCAFKQFKDFLNNSNFVQISLLLHPGLKLDGKSLKKLLNFESYDEDFNCNFYQVYYAHNELKLQEIDCFDNYSHNQEDFIKYEGKIEESIGKNIFNIFQNCIYRFQAERLNIGICKYESKADINLKSNASNLAEVLFILQGKIPGMFAQFNKLVSDILPEIKWISVVMRDDTNVEILVWNTDNLHRNDLSLPLSSCGSGVSQVLAILYILVSSEEHRTLIIDEPQSFLHPGAAKKLIETIKQFPQHQYFIATHSPEIIASANPSTIIKLQYQDCETTASVINPKEIESQNEILAELGVRLSDVFGADSILWVEGQTEENCFPMILDKVVNRQLNATKILAVKHTGDLEGTHASIIFDIYKKLSEGTNLFPPAIGFLLDSENRSEEDKQVLRERSTKPVEFLSRCMYENYLIDSEAIAVVFNDDNQSLQEPLQNITTVDVEKWLKKKKQEKGLSEKEWLDTIHASNILKQLFSNFSERKIKYGKIKHSYKLTKWLVDNKPNLLLGLAKEVANMLK